MMLTGLSEESKSPTNDSSHFSRHSSSPVSRNAITIAFAAAAKTFAITQDAYTRINLFVALGFLFFTSTIAFLSRFADLRGSAIKDISILTKAFLLRNIIGLCSTLSTT